MATATEILRKEHDAILKMLEVTSEVAKRLAGGQKVAPQTLADIVDFLRTFADRCHHSKEEDLLFPRLEAKGLPRQSGPVGVMLHEHAQGRALVQQLAQATDDYRQGKPEAVSQWVAAARSYVALLRQHIDKENNILFRLAEELLTAEEQQQLATEFEHVETEKLGVGTHKRLHKMLAHLVAEFLPK